MAKIDLKSAYRHVPLHPSNYQATGLKWKFNNANSFTYLYDTKLPFGAKRSPEIFHRLTQSITRMMSRRGFFLVAYLDDFLILSESEHDCWTAFWELITLLGRLGLTVNWNKVVYPCQRLTYLGIEIDSKRRQLRLPDHKLRDIRALLSQTLAKSKVTKRELQSLAGKLNFAARVVYGGRTFLRRIIDALNTLTRPYHRKRMTQTMRNDLLWWVDFMETFNGRTFFVSTKPTLTAEFSTDASLVGGGGHYQRDWFYVNWQSDFPHLQSCHINELELFTVLLALRRWGPQLSHKWIVIYTDNTVTKCWLNKGTSRSERTMVWLREIFWLSAVHNFRITSRYIQTTENTTADTLSRLHNHRSADHFLSILHSGSITNNFTNLSSTSLSLLPTQVQLALKNRP